jgi:hypothetical protein
MDAARLIPLDSWAISPSSAAVRTLLYVEAGGMELTGLTHWGCEVLLMGLRQLAHDHACRAVFLRRLITRPNLNVPTPTHSKQHP